MAPIACHRVSEEEVVLKEVVSCLGGHLSSSPPNKCRLDGSWRPRRHGLATAWPDSTCAATMCYYMLLVASLVGYL